MALEAIAIMAAGQHNSRMSSTTATTQMIRGWAKIMIQDTTKRAPLTDQAVRRSRTTTLGTILNQVVVETLGKLEKSFWNGQKTRRKSRTDFEVQRGKKELNGFITCGLLRLSMLLSAIYQITSAFSKRAKAAFVFRWRFISGIESVSCMLPQFHKLRGNGMGSAP